MGQWLPFPDKLGLTPEEKNKGWYYKTGCNDSRMDGRFKWQLHIPVVICIMGRAMHIMDVQKFEDRQILIKLSMFLVMLENHRELKQLHRHCC
ncbi:hypothetical protein DCC81_09465 [Chitinophaga parva]|uniref:Uncharacterized protein n=1 Tax=Chitinophaga parva TaxID=2169414 RepID=A0A2T7BPP4_9BACT|nr:hypothetical protein DCC81_09465 [Chitinophaga parva]